MAKWMCAKCRFLDGACECETSDNLIDVTHIYRAGQAAGHNNAAAEARRFGEETLARNIELLPLEGDDGQVDVR